MIAILFVVSILFYGFIFPAENFNGCYVNNKKTNRICINSDKTFEQSEFRNGAWEVYNNSIWSSTTMKDVAGEFSIILIESAKNSSRDILPNVVLQPYKDIFGRVKIPVGINSEDYEEDEIFKKTDGDSKP